MPRRSWLLLATACFAAFGVWRLLHSIPLLPVAASLSLVPFALFIQGLLSLLAAAALFYRSDRASLLVVLLGVAVGVTALLESFVWGVEAPLAGILVFVLAVVAALFLARWLRAAPVA